MRNKLINQKTFRAFAGLFIGLFLLSSCEKVVDIDLNEGQPKVVIEAVVTDQAGFSSVILSRTKNFDEDNSMVPINDAVVTIRENGGPAVVFPETLPGIYEVPGYQGSSGNSYELRVTVDGTEYTATSVMPQKVNLDTIYVTDEFLFGDSRKIVNTEYQDPVGRGNNYRFLQFINDRKVEQIFIQNDEYTDGRLVNNRLYYFADDDEDEYMVKSGDELKITMFCTDSPTFKYWFSLFRSSTGQSGQATPANPVSNIRGGALGYFSAQTTQTKLMTVP